MATSPGEEKNKIVQLNRAHITEEKKCSNCDFDLSQVIEQVRDDEELPSNQPLFCPDCGFSFGEYHDTDLICLKCKAILPKDEFPQMNYCHNCGRRFLKTSDEVDKKKKQASHNPLHLKTDQQG